MANNSDIIKIGFDYRASLAQFEKETNGVFDGISEKAGKQKIVIQLDTKNDKVIEKIKELQKLKLDKFTFEFGDSGIKEQLRTFGQLENKINEIITLSKGLGSIVSKTDFGTKNKTEAYNQLKQMADVFKNFYGNEEAMHTKAGTEAAYAYYKAYEEALRKGIAQSKLEKVTIDANEENPLTSSYRISSDRIKEFENHKKYGGELTDLSIEISALEERLIKFSDAYSQIQSKLGEAPITPEIIKNIEEYVHSLEVAEARAKDADLFGFTKEDLDSDKALADMYLDFATEDAIKENEKYISSIKEVKDEKENLDEVVSKPSSALFAIGNSSDQIDELQGKLNELSQRYEELSKNQNRASGKDIDLVDNEEFKKLSQDVQNTKDEITALKENVKSLFQDMINDKNVVDRMDQDFMQMSLTVDNLTDKIRTLQEELGNISSGNKSNISSDSTSQIGNEAKTVSDYVEEISVEIKNNTEEWNKAAKAVRDYRDILGDTYNVVQKIRTDKDGERFISYQYKGENGNSITLGENGDLVSSTRQVSNALDQKKLANQREVLNLLDEEARKDEIINELKKQGAQQEEELVNKNREYIRYWEERLDLEDQEKLAQKQISKEIEQQTSTQQKKWQAFQKEQADYEESVNKVNNAISKTDEIISNLSLHDKLDAQFMDLLDSVDKLNSKLKTGEILISEYNKSVKFLTSEYSKLVTIQQDRDVEVYQQNAKAAEQEAKQVKALSDTLKTYQDKVSAMSYKPDADHRFPEYQALLNKINTAITDYEKHIDSLKGKGVIDKSDITKAEELEDTIKSLLNETKKFSSGDKGFTALGADKALEKINSILQQNSAMSRQAKQQIKAYYNEILNGNPTRPLNEILDSVYKIVQAERLAGREGKSFLETLKDKAWYGWAAQLAGTFGVYDVINVFRQGATAVKEFEDGLTKISYTMDMTKSQLDDLGESVLGLASDMKSSVDDAMNVAQIYANMQTSAEEIQKLSEPTLILSNLSGFDSSTIADDIQAVTQQFDMLAEDSMHIADVYDYISRNIAVDYSKGLNAMAEGLQVAGSTAKQAGLSYEQTASIIAKAVEKTRLEGSQVGNGLKTLMTRLSKVGELSDEVDNETLSQASESLKKVGIEVYNLDGSYREFDVIMGELANKWSDLTDAEKSNISFNIAATRQTNLLSAVLSNFSDSMQLAEEATNANGNALENQQKYMDSFSGSLQSLETEAKIAWINILDSDTLKSGIDLLTGLVEVVGELVDKFGLLGIAGLGLGAFASFKNVGELVDKFGLLGIAGLGLGAFASFKNVGGLKMQSPIVLNCRQ